MGILKQDYTDIMIRLQDLEITSVSLSKLNRKLSVVEVSRKLGVNVETIFNILGGSRKDVSCRNYHNFKLTDDHLEVLAKAYVKSAKRHLEKNNKEVEKRPVRTLLDAIELALSSFKNYEPQYSLRSISDLNEDILRSEFFYRIYSSTESESYSSLNKIFSRYKIRLVKVFKDLREQLFSLIISNHYHIFPSEEESNRDFNETTLRYSIIYYRRVATLSNNAYLSQRWKNIKSLLKTLESVIYPKLINQNSLIFCQPNHLT